MPMRLSFAAPCVQVGFLELARGGRNACQACQYGISARVERHRILDEHIGR